MLSQSDTQQCNRVVKHTCKQHVELLAWVLDLSAMLLCDHSRAVTTVIPLPMASLHLKTQELT